jgi:hypothetical protein
MRIRIAVTLAIVALAAVGTSPKLIGQSGARTSGLARVFEINKQLQASGLNIAVEEVDFFTIGQARPSFRVHQQPFRWVANDARRLADGDRITYLVDQSDGRTASGLLSEETEAAIDRSFTTWQTDPSLEKVTLVKRPDPGQDPDIYDSFFGFGRFGNPFFADIVNAGWLPREYFETVGGPGGGRGILAFSVTFIFTDDEGNPTDINGDGYLDSALNEVYYNDTFGNRRTDRAGNPWAINQQLPAIDVETVSLHENGHSLGLGHFGPPPTAVMNPVYGGILQSPLSADSSGMKTIWGSWPR